MRSRAPVGRSGPSGRARPALGCSTPDARSKRLAAARLRRRRCSAAEQHRSGRTAPVECGTRTAAEATERTRRTRTTSRDSHRLTRRRTRRRRTRRRRTRRPTKTPPSTSIRTHPRKLVRTSKALARVVFRFASDPAGASFRCQFDGSPWRACAATVARWFGLGQHVVRVQASATTPATRPERRRCSGSGSLGASSCSERAAARPLTALRVGARRASRPACRRTIQWPSTSRAMITTTLPKTSGSVSDSPSSRVPK